MYSRIKNDYQPVEKGKLPLEAIGEIIDDTYEILDELQASEPEGSPAISRCMGLLEACQTIIKGGF